MSIARDRLLPLCAGLQTLSCETDWETQATTPPAALPRAALIAAIVVLAIPIAWLVAALGFTIAVVAPTRDVAVLLLWSASEEIVFRGGVQPLLGRALSRNAWASHRSRGGISVANLLTSLLFCAAHLLNKPALVVLGLFPVSLVLGASLERSGRLWVPVALHAYFNLLLYAASALSLS